MVEARSELVKELSMSRSPLFSHSIPLFLEAGHSYLLAEMWGFIQQGHNLTVLLK